MAYKVSVWMPNDKEVSVELDDIETAELFFEGYKKSGVFERISLWENENLVKEWENGE